MSTREIVAHITRTVQSSIDKVDKNASYAVYSGSKKFVPGLKPFLVALEWSCNGLIWMAATIVLILYNQKQTSMLPKLLIGLVVDIFYIAILKALARRRRPVYAYQRDQMIVASVDKHSFPSGHCSRSTYVALFAAHYFGRTSPLFSFMVSLWTISVCFSRVLLGRHHILDCVAGGILGWFNFATQFHPSLPVNVIGMFLIRSMFGGKSFSDPNDIEGMDAFTD